MAHAAMSVVIRLVAPAGGFRAPEVEGAWLKSFTPNGHGGRGDLVVTHDPAEAQRFADAAEAWKLWGATAAPPFDRRPDGKPNRPLTAWTITIEKVGS
jgi:hypothetical protein